MLHADGERPGDFRPAPYDERSTGAGLAEEEAMIARVNSGQVPQEQLEDWAHFVAENATTIRKMDGCLGTTYVVHRASGRILGITLWESEEKLRANEAALNQLRERAIQTFRAQGAHSDVYEVVVHH